MLNDRKGEEDSGAVGVSGKEVLHYRAEPTEESKSEDSSSLSLRRRSVKRR